jgi:hypothetical protein
MVEMGHLFFMSIRNIGRVVKTFLKNKIILRPMVLLDLGV